MSVVSSLSRSTSVQDTIAKQTVYGRPYFFTPRKLSVQRVSDKYLRRFFGHKMYKKGTYGSVRVFGDRYLVRRTSGRNNWSIVYAL